MKDIQVKASIGSETKTVILSYPNGSCGSLHINMDNYYHGQACLTSQGWKIYLNQKSELNNAEDIQVLINLLTKQTASE